MQLITILAAALPTLIATASAAECHMKIVPTDPTTNGMIYTVTASGVDDIPGICGGLWDNMHCTVFDTSCGGTDGNLVWKFEVFNSFCNAGDVTSAYWRATKNRFGAITCDV